MVGRKRRSKVTGDNSISKRAKSGTGTDRNVIVVDTERENQGQFSQDNEENMSNQAIPTVPTGKNVFDAHSVHNLADPVQSVCGPLDENISQRTIEKIYNGEYIDLSNIFSQSCEFQNLNLSLAADGRVSVARPEEKEKSLNFEQWNNAFLAFMYVYISRHPEKSRDLLLYMNTIRKMNLNYGWASAKSYDANFRLRLARNPSRSWAVIDGELFFFCMSSKSNQNNVQINKTNRSKPGQFARNNDGKVCFAYNRATCFRKNCNFEHKCSNCYQQHKVVDCPRKNSNSNSGGNNFRK